MKNSKKKVLESINDTLGDIAAILKINTDNKEKLYKAGLQQLPYDNNMTLSAKLNNITSNVYTKNEVKEEIQKEIQYDKDYSNFINDMDRAEEALEIVAMVRDNMPKDKYDNLELAMRIHKTFLNGYKKESR